MLKIFFEFGVLLLVCSVVNFGLGQSHYEITSIEGAPYLMKLDDKSLKGNDQYEGYCKDLADLLAKELNFTYTLKIVRDGKFGQPKEQKGEWTGMIGEVREGTNKIGIAPITITYARMQAVDFSSPFMEFQLSLLMKDPKDLDDDDDDDDDDDEDDDEDDYHGQYIFLRPMNVWLWLVFILGIAVTVGVLFGVEYLISKQIYEAKLRAAIANNLPPLPPPTPTGLCSHGICGSPRSGTGRLIQVVFWVYIVLFLAAYIATFAADRVVDRLDSDDDDLSELKLKSIEDVLAQDKVRMGALRGGSTYQYFLHTPDRVYRRIFSLINNAKGWENSQEDGVARVRGGNGSYAFIMEAPTAKQYSNVKPCNLEVAPEEFGPKRGYGVISKVGDPIGPRINLAILEMKENDELEDLEEKWFEKRNECKKKKDDDDDDDDKSDENDDDDNDDDDDDEEEDDHDPLCLEDMAGLFYLLLVALIVAFIVAFLEIRQYSTPLNVRGVRAVEVPMRET